METERKPFLIIPDYLGLIDSLPSEYREMMLGAVVRYGCDGKKPQFADVSERDKMFLMAIWRQLLPRLDYAINKRNAGEIGGKSGRGEAKNRSKKNTASKTQARHKQDTSCPQADTKQKPIKFKLGLINAGVTDEIASDFMDVRKGKKARDTQTALDAILSEIQTAKDNGTSADEFIKMAVVNSWQAPKYEWYKSRQDNTLTAQNDQRHADRRRTETKATSWQDYSETF